MPTIFDIHMFQEPPFSTMFKESNYSNYLNVPVHLLKEILVVCFFWGVATITFQLVKAIIKGA